MAKIAAVQMKAEDSMEKNYRKSLSFIKRAAKAGASMVCFPEGQLTRYIPQYPGLSPEGFAIPWDHDYIRVFCYVRFLLSDQQHGEGLQWYISPGRQ